jgi:hypothetical protein
MSTVTWANAKQGKSASWHMRLPGATIRPSVDDQLGLTPRQGPEAVRLDRDRGRHPGDSRRLQPADHRPGTLAARGSGQPAHVPICACPVLRSKVSLAIRFRR